MKRIAQAKTRKCFNDFNNDIPFLCFSKPSKVETCARAWATFAAADQKITPPKKRESLPYVRGIFLFQLGKTAFDERRSGKERPDQGAYLAEAGSTV